MPDSSAARRHILPLLGSLLLVFATTLGIRSLSNQSDPGRIENDAGSGNSVAARSEASRSAKASRRPRAASYGRDCDAWFAEVLARNPGLEPEWRSVADEDNGFLQLLDFAERHRTAGMFGSEQLPLPEDLLAILSGRSEWDHESVAAALAGHHDLVEEIARIGLLPEQSAAGIPVDRYSFVGARLYKQCAELLLADARLAAERGDAKLPLERVRAALGIARHMSGIETPSLLMESVSILVRLSVDDQAMQHILPALELDPGALADWQHQLDSLSRSPRDFSRALRGDAYVSIRGLAIPTLVGDSSELSKHDIPDPDAFIDASIGRMLKLSKQVEDSSIESLATTMPPEVVELPNHLSPGARDAYEVFYVRPDALSKGWARSMSMHARTDAVLAIMAGTEPPVEPITGLPFVFDPETRALAHPEDSRLEMINADPVMVPQPSSE